VPYTDLWLYDIKNIDDDIHIKTTGVSNKLILENLVKLSEKSARIHIRTPVIPGVNDYVVNMKDTAEFLAGISGVELVELLMFHNLGGSKYETLGIESKADGTPGMKLGRSGVHGCGSGF